MPQGNPEMGEQYRHFKDKMYEIVDIAIHSETKEKYVVYRALYGNFETYIRPLDMFISEVDHEKYPDVKQKYRFEYVCQYIGPKTSVVIDYIHTFEPKDKTVILVLNSEKTEYVEKYAKSLCKTIKEATGCANCVAVIKDNTIDDIIISDILKETSILLDNAQTEDSANE